MNGKPREVFTRLYKGKQVERIREEIVDKLNDACAAGVRNGYAYKFFEHASPNTFVIVAYLRTADNPVGMIACTLEKGVQLFGQNRVVHVQLLCSSTPGIGKVLMDVVVDYGGRVLKAEAIVLEAVSEQVQRYKRWGFHRGLPPDRERDRGAKNRYRTIKLIAESTTNLASLPGKMREKIAAAFPNQYTNEAGKRLKALALRSYMNTWYPPNMMKGKFYNGNGPEQIAMFRYLVTPVNRRTTAVSWKKGGQFAIPRNVKTMTYHTNGDKTWIEEKRKKKLQDHKRRWTGGNLINDPVNNRKRSRSRSPVPATVRVRSRSRSPVPASRRSTSRSRSPSLNNSRPRSRSGSPPWKIITPTTRAATPRPY